MYISNVLLATKSTTRDMYGEPINLLAMNGLLLIFRKQMNILIIPSLWWTMTP